MSWAPYNAGTSHAEDGSLIKRLVTGSCDNIVRIWRCQDSDANPGVWLEETKSIVSPHSDWVRDVAWAPNAALPYSMIASCSEDRTVFIWKQTDRTKGIWETSKLQVFDAPVWRVSWSITGNILAVSTGDHRVSLWKQSVDESWIQISTLDDTDVVN